MEELVSKHPVEVPLVMGLNSPIPSTHPTVNSITIDKGLSEFGLSEFEKSSIRRETGLTYELLCKTIVEGLKANKVVRDRDGDVDESQTEAAHFVRAKFLEPALKVLGEGKGREGGDTNYNLTVVQRNEIIQRVGRLFNAAET